MSAGIHISLCPAPGDPDIYARHNPLAKKTRPSSRRHASQPPTAASKQGHKPANRVDRAAAGPVDLQRPKYFRYEVFHMLSRCKAPRAI